MVVSVTTYMHEVQMACALTDNIIGEMIMAHIEASLNLPLSFSTIRIFATYLLLLEKTWMSHLSNSIADC